MEGHESVVREFGLRFTCAWEVLQGLSDRVGCMLELGVRGGLLQESWRSGRALRPVENCPDVGRA